MPGCASGPRIEQFSESASALNRTDRPTTDRMRPQLSRGGRGSGERHQVLLGQMVEQVADAAADQLHRAGRQQAGVHHQLDQPRGQVGGLAGWLDQAGHAGQERWRELLQRAPDREVERVDLHGHAAQRGHDVLAGELARLAERLQRALDVDGVVRQLAPGLAGVAEQHADAAVDVELGVAERRAGPGRQCVQLVPVLAQLRAERLQQPGALVEGQLAQRGAADRPAVGQRRGHVHPGRGDPGDLLAGDRVEHRARRLPP